MFESAASTGENNISNNAANIGREAAGGRNADVVRLSHEQLFVLRGDVAEPRFSGAIAQVFDLPLPLQANTLSGGDGTRLMWIGPNEWWWLNRQASRIVSIDAVREEPIVATEISDSLVLLRIDDLAVPRLSRGCPLDLHPNAFRLGQVAGSHCFKANIRLWRCDDGHGFELLVRASYAHYLVDLLAA